MAREMLFLLRTKLFKMGMVLSLVFIFFLMGIHIFTLILWSSFIRMTSGVFSKFLINSSMNAPLF